MPVGRRTRNLTSTRLCGVNCCQLERDWDPTHFITVHNKTEHNILLDLPTGYFRLDAGRTFRMMPDIAEIAQVKDLVAAGQVEIRR